MSSLLHGSCVRMWAHMYMHGTVHWMDSIDYICRCGSKTKPIAGEKEVRGLVEEGEQETERKATRMRFLDPTVMCDEFAFALVSSISDKSETRQCGEIIDIFWTVKIGSMTSFLTVPPRPDHALHVT